MALISTIQCTSCNEKKDVSHSSGSPAPRICHDCTRAEKAKKKERYLSELSTKTVEERIRNIEEWIYTHNQAPHGGQRVPRY